MPEPLYFKQLSKPTVQKPWPVLFSACLGGTACGYDGTDNGAYPAAQRVLKYPQIKPIFFCPEHFSFGTPRELCHIENGTGIDVLEGKARVITQTGKDWTKEMIRAAEEMLNIAIENQVVAAILLDISAACGTQVVYTGKQNNQRTYQIGSGVAAALLIKNGIPVLSQRDYKSLQLLNEQLDPAFESDPEAIDHHEAAWFHKYFTHSTF